MNIYPDYRYGKYITNEYEIRLLKSFLNDTNAKGKSNGLLLNSAYDENDKETWGDGTKSHFMTDGSGNVSQIQWSNKGFDDQLNLSGFKTMRLLSSHNNALKSVDLSDCSVLEKVFLYNNEITTLDLSNCKKLWYVRAQNNPMKDLTIYVNGRNRSFEAEENGTFSFTIDDRYTDVFSLYAEPDIGYKVKGIYSTGTGNLLSTKATWHFKPNATDYRITFQLDPDSYKYTLYPGDSQKSRQPYIQAAAKRLAELGYYEPYGTEAGTETSFTKEIVEATVKFQVVNDLSNTGNLAEFTWKALFSKDALAMVPDSQYSQVLAEYEIRKEAEAQAKAELEDLTIDVNSTGGKGYIKLNWTVSGNEDAVEGYEIWKSTKSSSGYKKAFTTSNNSYKNTAGLVKGTRYYYKVRAYKQVGEKKIYSEWSNKAYRIAK